MIRGRAKRRALTRPASTAANSEGHWLRTSPSTSTFHQFPASARLTCTAKGARAPPSSEGLFPTSVHRVAQAEPLAGARLLGLYRGAADPDVVVQHALPHQV